MIPVFDFQRNYIGSFGIIIFILWLLVKLVISPLTYKSYVSMAKMRLIKPQVDELNKAGADLIVCLGHLGIDAESTGNRSFDLLEKVDAQIVQQANLVFQNINSLRDSDTNSSGMTSYFLQIRDTDANILTTPLKPPIAEGVVSEPILPASGTMGDVVFGEPFTTSAIVHLSGEIPSRSTLSTARAPWRGVARRVMQNDNFVNIVFIGLPLGDSIDTISSLTRYCIMVGTAVVLLGGVLGMLVVQGTLATLKRNEKPAAKIAAGDHKQRIPATPENA